MARSRRLTTYPACTSLRSLVAWLAGTDPATLGAGLLLNRTGWPRTSPSLRWAAPVRTPLCGAVTPTVLTSASNPPVRTMSASDTASRGATQFLPKCQWGSYVQCESSGGAGI